MNSITDLLGPKDADITITDMLIVSAYRNLSESSVSISKRFHVSDTYAHDVFSKNHKCLNWTDYELTRYELEEADSLCKANWIEIELKRE